uniref:CCHC-type domain-containing protein n=1 Tax=Hucho hucho TaxID=62062 RepID=A0A4W5NME9_9TELE
MWLLEARKRVESMKDKKEVDKEVEPSQTWIVQIRLPVPSALPTQAGKGENSGNKGCTSVGERGGAKCYNCQKSGHFARECKAAYTHCGRKGHNNRESAKKGKRKCFNCQKTWHFARDCTAPCDYCGRKGHILLHLKNLLHLRQEKVLYLEMVNRNNLQ